MLGMLTNTCPSDSHSLEQAEVGGAGAGAHEGVGIAKVVEHSCARGRERGWLTHGSRRPRAWLPAAFARCAMIGTCCHGGAAQRHAILHSTMSPGISLKLSSSTCGALQRHIKVAQAQHVLVHAAAEQRRVGDGRQWE